MAATTTAAKTLGPKAAPAPKAASTSKARKPLVAEVTVLKHTKGAILVGVTPKEWPTVAFRGGYLTTAKAGEFGFTSKTPVGTKVRFTIEII